MSARLLTTGAAVMVLIAGPALADCGQEIQHLDEAVIEAETGAVTGDTGLPATEHQEEVLAGDAQGEGADTVGPTGMPATEHQREVLGETEEATGQEAAELVAEARELAAAGDEEGCMQRVAEARSLLGID